MLGIGLGGEEAGRQRVRGDALAAELGRERARQRRQAALGRDVGRRARHGEVGHDRGDQDQASPAALDHAGHHQPDQGMGGRRGRHRSGGRRRRARCRRRAGDRARRHCAPGCRSARRGSPRPASRPGRPCRSRARRRMAGGGELAEPGRQPLVRTAVQQHLGAGLGQALGHLPAQAATRARDQGGAAIEPELVGKGRHGVGHSSIAAARVSFVLANAATA